MRKTIIVVVLSDLTSGALLFVASIKFLLLWETAHLAKTEFMTTIMYFMILTELAGRARTSSKKWLNKKCICKEWGQALHNIKEQKTYFCPYWKIVPLFAPYQNSWKSFGGQKVLQAKSSLIGSLVLSKQPLMPPLLVIIWQCHSFDLEPKKVWKEQLLINRQVFPAKKTLESFKKGIQYSRMLQTFATNFCTIFRKINFARSCFQALKPRVHLFLREKSNVAATDFPNFTPFLFETFVASFF